MSFSFQWRLCFFFCENPFCYPVDQLPFFFLFHYYAFFADDQKHTLLFEMDQREGITAVASSKREGAQVGDGDMEMHGGEPPGGALLSEVRLLPPKEGVHPLASPLLFVPAYCAPASSFFGGSTRVEIGEILSLGFSSFCC